MKEQSEAQQDFLKRLRLDTAQSHAAVEELPISKALMSQAVNSNIVRVYLQKMYGLVQGLESFVYPLLTNIFIDLPARYKASQIATDLLILGSAPGEADALPIKKFTPASAEEAAGIMYVLEGSSLGGRVINKHLAKQLPPGKNSELSFFAGYRDQTGEMWNSFSSTLSQFAVRENADDRIIVAANKTFNDIKEWLADEDPEVL